MTSWSALDAEIATWAAAGRVATLWWRDDDAVADTPALQRLLAVAGPQPLALAVIPDTAVVSLADAVAAHPDVAVLQHGFAHRNHAPTGKKKSELGLDRPLTVLLQELGDGLVRLRRLFGAQVLAVLVPPWNRIDPAVVDQLPRLGFRGISCYGPRPRASHPLTTVNTHSDIIDWHGSRGFIGADSALGLLVGHLQARRSGAVDAGEPTGLITHHLVHDEACWDFLSALAARLEKRAGARWIGAPEAFAMARPAPAAA